MITAATILWAIARVGLKRTEWRSRRSITTYNRAIRIPPFGRVSTMSYVSVAAEETDAAVAGIKQSRSPNSLVAFTKGEFK